VLNRKSTLHIGYIIMNNLFCGFKGKSHSNTTFVFDIKLISVIEDSANYVVRIKYAQYQQLYHLRL
jgi:hypothetical protein